MDYKGYSKPKIARGKLGDVIFQINPTEITLGDSSNWTTTQAPGMSSPIQTYGSGNCTTYSFELYVNDRHFNKKYMTASEVIDTIHRYAKGDMPVLFTYMGRSRKVVVTEASTLVQSMNRKLVPTEATISISLNEFYD